MSKVKEGLTVYHPTPEEPRAPYPTPIKVTDPSSLRRARIKALFHIWQKKNELAYTMYLSLSKMRNPELRQIIWANYRKQLMERDEVWAQLISEMRVYHFLILKRLKAMTGR